MSVENFKKRLEKAQKEMKGIEEVTIVMNYNAKTKRLNVRITPEDANTDIVLGTIQIALTKLIRQYIKEGKIKLPKPEPKPTPKPTQPYIN